MQAIGLPFYRPHLPIAAVSTAVSKPVKGALRAFSKQVVCRDQQADAVQCCAGKINCRAGALKNRQQQSGILDTSAERTDRVEAAASGTTPSSDRRPEVVFRPTRSFQTAGMRTDPPVSEPMPAAASPNATEAAAPEDDPPATASGSLTDGGDAVIGL